MRKNMPPRINGRFPPTDVTPQEAFEVLQGLPVGDRTLQAHAAAMGKSAGR